MKKFVWLALVIALLSVFIYGCAKVVDETGGGGGGSSTLGALTGSVVSSTGGNIGSASVTITTAATQAVTNGSGWFAIGNLSAGVKTITIAKALYVTYSTTIEVIGGQSLHRQYVLSPANTAQSFNAATVATATDNNPNNSLTATVTVPANALVTAGGAAYSGTYLLALTPGDPSSSSEIETFPGRMIATTATGDAYLISYGFADFNVTDPSGNPLNLGTGQTATWRQEIPASMAAAAPSVIPMWYFDTATNAWKPGLDASGNQLMATKVLDGTTWYYVGSINHFSTWNYDVSNPPAFISGRVTNGSSEVIEGAEVKCWGEGWVWRTWRSGETGTNAQGVFTDIPVERDKVFFCQATKGSQKSQVYTFGPFAGNTHNDVGDLVIAGGSTANIMFILTWGAQSTTIPSDLDSHLTTPHSSPESAVRGHVWYSYKGSPTSFPYAWLDVDDTSWAGPEVTTVTRKIAGTYRFCIHNYSGQYSAKIENSLGKVEAFISGMYYAWTVPTSNPNDYNVWRVCDLIIDAGGGVTVSPINDYAPDSGSDTYSPAGALGAMTQTQLMGINNKKK